MAVHIHFHDYRHRDGGPGSGPRKGGGSTVIKSTSTTSSEAEHKQRIKTAHSLGVEPEHMYPNHQRRAGDPRLSSKDGGPGSGPRKGGGKGMSSSEVIKKRLESNPAEKSAFESDMLAAASRKLASGIRKGQPMKAHLNKQAEQHEAAGRAKWNKIRGR